MIKNTQLNLDFINSNVMVKNVSYLNVMLKHIITDINNKIINVLDITDPVIITDVIIKTSPTIKDIDLPVIIKKTLTDVVPIIANHQNNINTNIFPNLYSCFKNLLYPIGSLNSEEDFIFCIFNNQNPFDINFKNNINISISSQYSYSLKFSNNQNFYFPLALFYITKLYYRKVNASSMKPSNINYYILPESLTSLDQLNGITYLLADDILSTAFSLFYILSDMGFTPSLPSYSLPSAWPYQTIDYITHFIYNIFTRLVYSLFVIFLGIKIGASPFRFSTFTNNINFNLYKSRPIITNKCSTCVSSLFFGDIYNNPIIISGNINIDKSNPILINLSNSFIWSDLFNNLNVTFYPLYVLFNDTYVLQFNNISNINEFCIKLKQLNSIIFIRQDMIFISNSIGYIIFNSGDSIYARPASFIPIKTLPGIIDTFLSDEYILNLTQFFDLSLDHFKLYKRYGISLFDSKSYSIIKNAYERVGVFRHNTCYETIARVNTPIHKYMYLYLLYKHISDGTAFTKNPHFITQDANLDLLAFTLALNTNNQSNISITNSDNSITYFDPYNPDIDLILSTLESLCSNQFNSLKDKNKLDKFCRCLYRPANDLSPICFDPKCKLWTNDPDAIYKKYNCKYPVCTQAISITNFIAPTFDLNNISNNISCGAYTNSDSIQAGNYNIYFNNSKLYWSFDNNIYYNTDSIIKHTFTIINMNESFAIADMSVFNFRIIKDIGKYIPFVLGLYKNELYIIHKTLNVPIFYDQISLLCKNTTINQNITVTFVKVK